MDKKILIPILVLLLVIGIFLDNSHKKINKKYDELSKRIDQLESRLNIEETNTKSIVKCEKCGYLLYERDAFVLCFYRTEKKYKYTFFVNGIIEQNLISVDNFIDTKYYCNRCHPK